MKQPHPNDMTAEQLRELVSAMGWAAMDLAQHLSWLNEVVHGAAEPGYVQAQRMAYALTEMPYSKPPVATGIDVAVYGADGLTRIPMTWDDLRNVVNRTDEEQGR